MAFRKKSEIWNHFDFQEEDNKAKCSYCSSLINISKGSTGNLTRHMRTKHVSIPIYRDKNVLESVPLDNNNDNNSKSEEPMENKNEMSNANIPSVFKIPKRQEYMDKFVMNVKPVSINRSKQFDEQLLRMIVKEYHPFSIVEDNEFKKFINMLCPGYSLPSRKTVTDTLMPKMYNKIRDTLKHRISHAYAVCITTDSWTSLKNENFTAITAHWLVDNEKDGLTACFGLLDCIVYRERHTAENLSELLQTKINEWGIQNKIVAAVSDNAANIVAGIRHANWRHIGCFAHTVNLIVQKGLKSNEHTVNKIRKVVEFFKRSSHGLAKVNQIQEQMGLPILKLKIDVSTRWNSTFDMLNRFCQRKDAVISTLAILQHEVTLNATDWEVANHAIVILQVFNDVTSEISAEKNIAVSKIFLLHNAMDNHVRQCKATILLEELQPMMDVLLNELASRYKSYENNELIQQATLLDPRFKRYGFVDTNKANLAIEIMKNKIKHQKGEQLGALENEKQEILIIQTKSSSSSSSKSLLWKNFDEKVQKIKTPNNPTAAAIVEVEKYLNEPLIDRHEDPLLWWFQRKNIYPTLYELVKKRLCIMPTSVPCERIFSKTGQIVTEKRNRLRSSKTSEIIFLHVNL
ncbi:unnamed protein product [Psylliodes chrysocephalus]|uniref:BED-type domain-containing protein n=1 Tax=Psylliodes chrysocephalus TaxID=3402493 RepID=A0A9P0CQ26_9CUCU|nr:unnamed protein product [Psylliodes chrysocephala]